MNEGVKILIERMKTNPEEFIADGYSMTKWGGLISQYRDYLNEEDKKALTDALNEITQQRFTEAVMKELLAPEEDNSLGKPWYTGQPTGMLSAGTTLGGVTLSSGAGAGSWGTSAIQLAQAQQAQIQHDSTVEHMKAHIEALQKPKKHKTLFGKLFNYS